MKKSLMLLSSAVVLFSTCEANAFTYVYNGVTFNPYFSTKLGYARPVIALDGASLNIPDISPEVDAIIKPIQSALDVVDLKFESRPVFSTMLAVGTKIQFNDVKPVTFRLELEYQDSQDAKMEDKHISLPISEEVNFGIGISAKSSSYTMMLNGYIDVETKSFIKPYVSFGVGKTKIDASISASLSNFSISDFSLPFPVSVEAGSSADNIIWSVGSGMSFELTKAVSLDLQYRYIDYGKIGFGDELSIFPLLGLPGPNGDLIKATVQSHQFALGLRCYF